MLRLVEEADPLEFKDSDKVAYIARTSVANTPVKTGEDEEE